MKYSVTPIIDGVSLHEKFNGNSIFENSIWDDGAMKVTVISLKPFSQLNKAEKIQVSCFAHVLVWEKNCKKRAFSTFFVKA